MIHMIVVETRFAGPTNTRGARVLVREALSSGRRARSYEWQHELGIHENHERAARLFLRTKPSWCNVKPQNGYLFGVRSSRLSDWGHIRG